MADLTRPERLQVMLDEEELAALDDWRFRMRMPSRAAAIRELLKRGLASEETGMARAGEKSSNFGVITDAKSSSFDGVEGKRAHPVGARSNGNGSSPKRT